MASIDKILHIEDRGSYALVHVLVGQDEAVVYVGGTVELFFDDAHNKLKAFVKKSRVDKD